jgi:hypothetical protein
VFWLQPADGTLVNVGGGKEPSVIPSERVEIIFSPPPYVHSTNAAMPDGFGDAGMVVKTDSRRRMNSAATTSSPHLSV